jgi:hypothetical protein
VLRRQLDERVVEDECESLVAGRVVVVGHEFDRDTAIVETGVGDQQFESHDALVAANKRGCHIGSANASAECRRVRPLDERPVNAACREPVDGALEPDELGDYHGAEVAPAAARPDAFGDARSGRSRPTL